MNLGEILLDIDVLVENSVASAIKVRWINQIQRQCYRDLPIAEELYAFDVYPDQQIYPVPDNCSLDNITSVLVDGREYETIADGERILPWHFWTNVAGEFMLNKVPHHIAEGLVTYKPTPQDLVPNDLAAIPMLPSDYHQLLVDGCAARVAKAEGDSKANALEQSFDRLFLKAKRDLAKPLPDMRVI